jgi:ectoine hydroxylase-related dioxygenase (phytanoyl-CoA dioxygenase family)
MHSAAAKRIFDSAELKRIASLIFARPGDPTFTINFMYGSRQALHQDSCVFHIAPPNYVMVAWLACENISPDSGPLVFCPASHKEPIYPGFDDYPQTNLRTMPKERMQEYYDYVSGLAAKYERKQFLGSKGDVLLWHGMLIHGGDEVKRPELTRKSYVCHYVPPGMDVSSQVNGPFNW